MDDLILKAARFAARQHTGQSRKYTARPYVTHPARVAAMAMLLPDADPPLVCAALLHDVIEDCGVTAEQLAAEFGSDVASIVDELTNRSKLESPGANRAQRKALDRARLKNVSRRAKLLKLLDRIDNLREMDLAPSGFRRKYLDESRLLLEEVLSGVEPNLEAELLAEIKRHEGMLALERA